MANRITLDELKSYLWQSAVLLRTNIDAGAYKQYIFPLMFFKRICDVYDEEAAKALAEYSVDYCYLFGSYAKGTASEQSDVDLLVSMPVDGLKFFELLERLREGLKKKVDLLDTAQLRNNEILVQEILKDGIKIYSGNV